MATRTCPDCDAQYLATIRRCIDCDTLLVDEIEEEPATTAIRDADDDHGTVRLTLDGWDNQLKVTLDGMLQRQGVPHVWEAGDLVIAASHRDELAELLDAVEGREVDPEAGEHELVALEIEGLDADHRELLDGRLLAAGLGHAWSDDGALLVDVGVENQVIGIVEGLFDESVNEEPEDVNDRLSELFVSVDRLVKRIGDERAEQSFRDAVDALDRTTVPYGFDSNDWRSLVISAQTLVDRRNDDIAMRELDRSERPAEPDDVEEAEGRDHDRPGAPNRDELEALDDDVDQTEPDDADQEAGRQERLIALRDRLRDLV